MDTVRLFTDRAAIASYAEDTPRRVPGYADLHRMAMLLLAERAPRAADILVYGAGGGLELKAFAGAQPDWRFTGIDPSAEMLDLAREILGPLHSRVILRQGYIDDAPQGPFDGATCLLTLHFCDRKSRLEVLQAIRRRLKPSAPLIVAHHSCPAGSDLKPWLTRSIAFADRAGHDLAKASASAETMISHLPILSSDEDEALLRQAGFSDVALFYAGFSFRGWIATA
ncbi:class I SAM-dependent methyltransferase [Sphingomonas albertensis]|uniref:Class I SAM-dependent methyltransferase n=1 Tax=Sphingomonas albertensis TaxID=2762591 RepID=A0ABR7AKU9_9SPHN|nr:class I SAM-dependent methyltransferase [Sphingomonas albertensis]MBC3941086.1 class I SAM-dependent methyltransferase [Sphingomonas albertensis]